MCQLKHKASIKVFKLTPTIAAKYNIFQRSLNKMQQQSQTVEDLLTENNFLKLIDIIPDAIFVVDQNGNIKFANSHSLRVFGYESADLIGQKIEILVPNKYKESHVKAREKYTKAPKVRQMGSRLDLYGRKKDGLEIPVDIMLAPIVIDNKRLIISTVRDISDRKQIELDLRKRAMQLEDTVSAMTHDLKTPLIAAETSYKHFLDGTFGKLTDRQKEIIELLSKSNENALNLVKNLLSVFQYESQSYKLYLESISINEIINKAVSMVKPLLDEKDIKLKKPDVNFQFICDAFEIERVIINLLSNAVKHTSRSGYIEIKAIKDEEGKVLISIEDTGIGLETEDLTTFFERFWQSKRTSEKSQSTGLGLYLCKQIIDAHKGKIWAESEVGKGTKISFEIPPVNKI